MIYCPTCGGPLVEDVPMEPPKLTDLEYAEVIYSHYPRRIRKAAAIKSILRALKKIDPEKLLTRTLEFAFKRKDEDNQYTPYPATWFNQEGYNDNPESSTIKHSKNNRSRSVGTANEGKASQYSSKTLGHSPGFISDRS